MPNDSTVKKRGLEIFVQAVVVYSIIAYFMESELTEIGYLPAGNPFFLWSERFLAAFFATEYVVRWFYAKDRLRYPLTLLAIIDLMAILPFFVVFVIDLRSLKLFRMLRILRLFKLYRYNRALQNVMVGFRQVRDELAVVGFVVIIVVMFSSAAMHEFEHDSQPEKFSRLTDSIWWSFITLTTVGYGDLCPVTPGGRVIAIVTMIIGSGIFGTFISLVGSSFLSTMRNDTGQPQPTSESDASGSDQDANSLPWKSSGSEQADRADVDRADIERADIERAA